MNPLSESRAALHTCSKAKVIGKIERRKDERRKRRKRRRLNL